MKGAPKPRHGAELSAYDPEFRACPHRVMDEVRAAGACYPDPVFDRVILTGFQASRALLLRTDVSVAPRNDRGRRPDAVPDFLEATMLQHDPPGHTRLRGLIGRTFSAPQLKATWAEVEANAAELLDGLDGAARFDLRARYALPLATRTMADKLGMARSMHPRLIGFVQDLEVIFDPIAPPVAQDRMAAARTELDAYFRQRVASARQPGAPADDLVGRMAQADASVGTEDVAANCVLLLGAGIATTADLITNGAHLLLRNPDQLARLRAEPGLMDAAVEEALRLEPPIAQYSRIVLDDTVMDGVPVPAGSRVTVSAIGTGHDPALHDAPGRFDLSRSQHAHLAFAAGIHVCPGSLLARKEAAIAWRALLGRFPALRLAEPPRRRVSLVFNGLEQLHVAVG